MKTAIAITLCLCLLLVPLAQGQANPLIDSIIKGCQGSSGLNGLLCKGAVSLGESFCKSSGGNCIKLLTDLCRVSWILHALQLAPAKLERMLLDGIETMMPSWARILLSTGSAY